ncbi:MAG: ATP-binding protein [Acidobacteriota bacterium]|nr:ATP-binding protein [Acidobacteriota bacterium]
MSNLQRKGILSTAGNLIGRTRELDALMRHAKGENSKPGLLLLSAPSAGATELLKTAFDRLFCEQKNTIPFYFALKKTDETVRQSALRFLQNFLQQTVAFRRRDAKLLNFSGDVSELARIAVPGDGYWIDRLVEIYQNESETNDERAFVRQALSAPLRAVADDTKIFVIIDDLHEAENLTGETDFLAELHDIFSHSGLSFVFAGRRRFLFDAIGGNYEIMRLEPLSFSDAGTLAEDLAGKFSVVINEQTRDLLAAQMQGNPQFIKSMFLAASERRQNLDCFRQVEKIYTDELFGGRIGRFYDDVLAQISPNVGTQKNIIGLLFDSLTIEKEQTPIEAWRKRAGFDEKDFRAAVSRLNTGEMIRLSSNHAETMKENEVLTDYIAARFRLEVMGENRALTVAESLSSYLKRAPKTMARVYRRNSSIGLRELLSVFDRQEIPLALLDYSRFRDEYKGAPTDELLKTLAKDAEKIRLPQLVYSAHTMAFYPPIEQSIEKERSAVAVGFQESKYTDEDETIWMAAEIDSKLEAAKDLTEFWCDRLEVVALMCNFLNFKIWLIAPEGFSPEAVEVLRRRNAFGSSRRQVELLIKTLDAEVVTGEKLTANEYEIIIPMGEDTEMIAAQTIEEIARRHHFAPKAINQIKTALIEACINATEHSLSPDRKIYQKFAVENDKIVITIANRGLRLSDKKSVEITPDEGRRGWGLKLMKTLMDEVKFEETDDGTQISMTKYLQNS